MNLLLSFNNMFKWKGPLDIKWDNPFGNLNYTWTHYEKSTYWKDETGHNRN